VKGSDGRIIGGNILIFVRRKWEILRQMQSDSNVRPSDYRPKFSMTVPLEF